MVKGKEGSCCTPNESIWVLVAYIYIIHVWNYPFIVMSTNAICEDLLLIGLI
jgi:hypothetical protein